MERITTAEAARRLGVSVATVRRRIAAGALPAERVSRPGGVVWVVLWDGEPVRSPERAHDAARERGGERDALAVALHTIERLERELDIAHAEKAQLLQALNARALAEPAREPSHERAAERTPEPPPPPQTRRWWRFWRQA